jgi:small-conductance mechanosensitive channel
MGAMPPTFEHSPLARTLEAIRHTASVSDLAVQLAVVAGALLLAWIATRLTRHRLKVTRWQFGKGEFERVAFPAIALALVWTGKEILSAMMRVETGPIEIAVYVLWAFVVIRAASYILGHVLPEGEFQSSIIRSVAFIAWVGLLLRATDLMPEVLDALDTYHVTQQVTVLDVLKVVLALFLSITVALWISRVTEGRVMAAESLEPTTRLVISKITRVIAILLAIFVALPMAGIDVTTLSVFTGALGVGLGFGLQKVASNYVSGFIVLLDRSIRIGDVILVDGRRGQVIAIQSRCTVIRSSDGVESIIPNEKLITDSIGHHTYSSSRVAASITTTIAYGSDVDQACAILVELAKKHRRVLADPGPSASVKQLGERGIDLELTVWINDPVNGDGDIRSHVLKGVLTAFPEAKIGIPPPQREVRLIATAETPKI